MAIKAINYSVTAYGITPAGVQQGGVQGDHNVTEIIFQLDDVLYTELQLAADGKKLVYRFDGYDSAGGKRSTEPQLLTDKSVSYSLEEWLTRYGGKITVYLIFSVIDENGENLTELEFHTFAAYISLKDKPDAKDVNGENYESISALSVVARESAAAAAAAKKTAVDAKDKTEAAKAALEGGTRWVFDGGGAKGNAFLSLVTDAELSDTSINPVQNKIIKAAIDAANQKTDDALKQALEAAETAKIQAVEESDESFVENFNEIAVDYVVETGLDNGWRYRKYNSGLYEAYKTHAFSGINCAENNYDGVYYSGSITPTLPSFSTYVSNATVGGGDQSHILIPIVSYAAGTVIRINLIAHVSTITSATGNLYIQLKGNWKTLS